MTRRLPALLCLAAVGAAEAHVGDLFGGMDVVLSGPAGTQVIDASFGLLWSDDGAQYDFICHEAILGPEAFGVPAYVVNDAGVMIGIVQSRAVARVPNEPVYRSIDGCTWDIPTGLFDLQIIAMSFDPANGDEAIAATADLEPGATNQVLRSTDGGQSWAGGGLSVDDGFFRGVGFSAAGSRWATSVRMDQDHATVHRSLDGETWTSHDVSLPVLDDGRVVLLDLLAVSPTDADTAWFVRGPIGGPDELMRTTDGGETLEVIYESRDDISDAAATEAGALWVILATEDVLVAADGVNVTEAPPGTPPGAGIEARGGTLVMATKDALIDGTLATSTNGGESWSEELVLDLISGARDCPAETHGGQCAALWQDTLERLVEPRDTGTPETADTDADELGGCDGCSGTGGAAGWPPAAALLLLLALRRRR